MTFHFTIKLITIKNIVDMVHNGIRSMQKFDIIHHHPFQTNLNHIPFIIQRIIAIQIIKLNQMIKYHIVIQSKRYDEISIKAINGPKIPPLPKNSQINGKLKHGQNLAHHKKMQQSFYYLLTQVHPLVPAMMNSLINIIPNTSTNGNHIFQFESRMATQFN